MPSISWNRRWGVHVEQYGNADGAWGDQWGDTEARGLRYLILRLLRRTPGNLARVVDLYITPFVLPQSTVLEIGPGGGRWTKHLLNAGELLLVDLNPEFFPYLKKRFPEQAAKIRFYETSGYELDAVLDASVDFIFSFGTFVHIDPEGIDAYLGAVQRVLKPSGVAVLQYADKTKALRAMAKRDFSDMNASRMEALVQGRELTILKHDTAILDHSNIVVLTPRNAGK